MKAFELTDDQLAWVYRNQGKGITIKDAVEKMLPQLVGFRWKRKDKIITIMEEKEMDDVQMIFMVVGIEGGILGYLEAYENELEAEGRLEFLGKKLELSYDEHKEIWYNDDWDIFIEGISLD